MVFVLTSALYVPADYGFTGIYLVDPQVETPRRFALLGSILR